MDPIPPHKLSKAEFIFIGVLAALILVIGLILLYFNYNDAFYSPDPNIRKIFSFISSLGGDFAIIGIFGLFFFAYDKQFSRRLMINFLFYFYTCNFLKSLFQDPRPATNFIDGEPIESSYGFPSGHAQGAIQFYGYIYLEFKERKRKWFIQIWSLFCMIMIPISRMVVGVHDLQDVFGGVVIGLILLAVFILSEPSVMPKVEKMGLKSQLIFGIFFSIVLWVSMLLLFFDDAIQFAIPGGAMLGAVIGFPLEEHYIHYEPRQLKGIQRFLIPIIGLVITFVSYLVIGLFFDVFPENIYFITRFLRYCLVSIVVTLLCPWIFTKILKITVNLSNRAK
jgi:glycerophosphoryl diester phosphodiesterase